MPYVSASTTNNGVDGFISNTTGVRIFNHCLTVVNIGNVGKSLYHNYEFVASDNVTALKNPAINRCVYLFLAPIVSRLEEKYDYGRIINDTRINKEIMLLPVTAGGNPDWKFMADYIREREQRFVQRYVEHAEQILHECNSKNVTPLAEKMWGEFALSSGFSIQSTSSSIDKIKLAQGDGMYPYLTRTDRNNGIDSFVCSQKNYALDEGNCITIGLDTQTAFYQPIAFYTGQNIQILRNDNLNRYTAKFLLPLLKNLLTIFNWGSSGATLTRLRRSKILLPIDDNGKPDWAYMEQYAKSVTRQQVQMYLTHVKAKQDYIVS